MIFIGILRYFDEYYVVNFTEFQGILSQKLMKLYKLCLTLLSFVKICSTLFNLRSYAQILCLLEYILIRINPRDEHFILKIERDISILVILYMATWTNVNWTNVARMDKNFVQKISVSSYCYKK